MLHVVRTLPEFNLVRLLRRRGIDTTPLLQWGVIIAVLLASVLIGLRPSILLLALPVGAAGALLFLRQPTLSLLLVLQAGMVVPFYGPGGLNLTMIGTAALIGLWIIGMLIEQRRIWFTSPETAKPALIFVLVAILAFVVGQLPWYRTQAAPMNAQIGGLMVFVISIGAFLFVGNKFKDLYWIEWFTWGFLIYGFLHMVSWLVPRLGDLYASALFAYGTNGSMFWTWIVILAFSQAVFNTRLTIVPRLALFVLVAMTMYVAYVLNGDWKSGWMPAAIGVAVILLLRSWRFGYLFAVMGIYPAMKIFSSALASDEYSYSTRVDAWTIVLEIVKANPILGLGPANYYWYTPLFPIRGYAVNFNSHNQYIDLIAQTGIVGLVAFLWLSFAILKVAWQLRTKVDRGFEEAYVYGALGGWAAFLAAAGFGDWILPFVYNVGLDGMRASILPWVFFGGLVALQVKYQGRASVDGEIG
ncbi:MAG TPA: O-antigen ligase family protein [Caldilineaceae bacterium]|nr:O-antigen ligase family protein [Caldilineaceae bacterium]